MAEAPSVIRRSSHIGRAAVVLYAVAQLFIALATVTEGRFGADARAHVEAAGTSVHHAHDEAGCAACSARAMLSTGGRQQTPPVIPLGAASPIVSQTDARPDVDALARSRPRAPPLRLA